MPRIILLADFGEGYANSLLRGVVKYSKGREGHPAGRGTWVLCKMPLSYRDDHGLRGVLEWALRWKADGIIAQFSSDRGAGGGEDAVALFRQHGIAATNITSANLTVGEIGATHFLQRGLRSFAFYGAKGVLWSQKRVEGFVGEIARHGFKGNFSQYHNPDVWFYDSTPLMEWLVGLPVPVGIMACNDAHAHHLVEACSMCGLRIPDQVMVLGVDNDEFVCTTLSDPPLSSIEQDVERGGWEAAALIERMIEEPEGHLEDVVVNPTRIVTRQSTEMYASEDYYISLALRHIHQNIDQRLHVEDIVRLVPLSRRLLEIRFRQVTGLSVYSYISNLRVERFAKRLLETDEGIVEIALELGFHDYKNVARQFKNIKGCTPSEFRVRSRD